MNWSVRQKFTHPVSSAHRNQEHATWQTIAVAARHSTQLYVIKSHHWPHYFRRNSMDFGPIVTIKHDSRSPSGLETFCCLRFWLRGEFKLSKFLWCTTQACTFYVGGPTLPWGSTILGVTQWILLQFFTIEHDSWLPSGLETFCRLRFWLLWF